MVAMGMPHFLRLKESLDHLYEGQDLPQYVNDIVIVAMNMVLEQEMVVMALIMALLITQDLH